MLQRLILPVILSAAFFVAACGDDRIVTAYPLMKVDPKTSFNHEWLPMNPTTYRVSENKVVSNTIGFLRETRDCTVWTANEWECRYSDGSGTFGFRDGTYWENPQRKGLKYVSRFEYNLVRCKWSINDPHEGLFWGTVSCILGWD